MKNPLYDRAHIKEYLLFGSIAALVFTAFLVVFLIDNKYENMFLLFVGSVAFSLVIAIHGYMQINRRHEGKSAVRMLLSSNLTLIIGVVLSTIFSIVATLIFFGGLTNVKPSDAIVENAHTTSEVNEPGGLLLMILVYAAIVNFAVGAFLSVLISYAGKRNQTKDKPAELDNDIHLARK